MSVLIVAEHHHQQLSEHCRALVTAARQLSDEVVVLIAGHDCRAVAEEAAKLAHVEKVLLADHAHYQHALPEALAPLVVGLMQEKALDCAIAAASSDGKNLLPRVAALLDVPQLSDVCQIIDKKTFKRPIYAGNAFSTVSLEADKKIMTIRPTHFDPVLDGDAVASIESCDMIVSNQHSEFVKLEGNQADRPDLTSAKIVISGGRALQSAENFQLIERIADKLNAAIGASRAAVDAGYVSNDLQVGQTGKVVAPELYIAVGISGAIQHLAGMKDSKVIVAINKDPDAPIFKVADYGIVGDLFELLPQLEAELAQLG